MEVLVVFTSEEEGVEEILKILQEKGVQNGVSIASNGMRKVLGAAFFAENTFGVFKERRPFNRTILAIMEKENIPETIQSINGFWKSDKDKETKKNRVMFSMPIKNLTLGV